MLHRFPFKAYHYRADFKHLPHVAEFFLPHKGVEVNVSIKHIFSG